MKCVTSKESTNAASIFDGSSAQIESDSFPICSNCGLSALYSSIFQNELRKKRKVSCSFLQ